MRDYIYTVLMDGRSFPFLADSGRGEYVPGAESCALCDGVDVSGVDVDHTVQQVGRRLGLSHKGGHRKDSRRAMSVVDIQTTSFWQVNATHDPRTCKRALEG
jgi:hypothetical protein